MAIYKTLNVIELLRRVKIRTKIIWGFALILALLVLVSVMSVTSLTRTKSSVAEVVEVRQPVTFKSMELLENLERSGRSLGFYLLSKEADDKQVFLENVHKVDQLLNELKSEPAVVADATTGKQVETIEQSVIEYRKYQQTMIELAENQAKNIPGMMYAARNLNPVSQQMLQMITQAILSEEEEDATQQRKAILNDLNNLRYAWANAMNGVRAYLAFRQKQSMDEFYLYAKSSHEISKKILDYGGDLNLDQEDSVLQYQELQTKFEKNFEELKKMHGSEQWRQDGYLIKTELSPLLGRLSQQINALMLSQREQTESVGQDLLSQVGTTIGVVISLLIVGIILGGGGAMLVSVLVSRPLNQTVVAMEDIANGEGDLTQRLDDSGSDELSDLAKSFNVFVEKIQHTMGKVTEATSHLATASEQMEVVTADTAEGVINQQRETELVATALNEMTATA